MLRFWLLSLLLSLIALSYIVIQRRSAGQRGLMIAGLAMLVAAWAGYLNLGASQPLSNAYTQAEATNKLMTQVTSALQHPAAFTQQLSHYLQQHPQDCHARQLLYKLLVSQHQLKQATKIRIRGKRVGCIIKRQQPIQDMPQP